MTTPEQNARYYRENAGRLRAKQRSRYADHLTVLAKAIIKTHTAVSMKLTA